MSGWLDHIGTASNVTTPSGSVPSYNLALDLGTAQWSGPRQRRAWARDTVTTSRAGDIQRAKQKVAEAETGGLGGWIGKTFKTGLGFILAGPEGDFREQEEYENLGEEGLVQASEAIMDTPVIGDALEGMNYVSNLVETPFVLDTQAMNEEHEITFGHWFDKDAWGKAWRAAEDMTLGQALVDAVVTGGDHSTTRKELDRMKRTNSLYQVASFGADMYVGFKFDPTVIGAKVVGETRNIARGYLPKGQTSKKAAQQARQAIQADVPQAYRYHGANPLGHYGAARGRRIAKRFPDLFEYAKTHDITDVTGLHMFQSKVQQGGPMALAVKLAAGNEKLETLTRKAMVGDAEAFRQIRELQTQTPETLRDYAPNAPTYLDAINATKGHIKSLDDEIGDLEKNLDTRFDGPLGSKYRKGGEPSINPGFFDYHNWELHRYLDLKKADMAEATKRLEGEQDYADWLQNVDPDIGYGVEQVSARHGSKQLLSSHTYGKSQYSQYHTVSSIPRAMYVRQANPIHLHDVDSGVVSIRRQFEQYAQLGFYDRDAVNNVLDRFIRAPDETAREVIAREVEMKFGTAALAQKHDLSPETIETAMRHSRIRTDDMMDQIVTGKDSVYSTFPGDDMKFDTMEGGRKHTIRLPVSRTQMKNYYMPMNVRQMSLTIERNADLFKELDSAFKSRNREYAGVAMEAINTFGTTWNQIWKPLQLFRLAWPMRVFMDEAFRSMSMLGMGPFIQYHGQALVNASLNAINPALHGVPLFTNRKVKIGPGPIADEVTGKRYDIPSHDAELELAPSVPAYFEPRINPQREASMSALVAQNVADRRYRLRREAILRDPQETRSFPHKDIPRLPQTDPWPSRLPEEGLDLQAHLIGAFPERPYNRPGDPRIKKFLDDPERSKAIFDPATGREVTNGYSVPVISQQLAPRGVLNDPRELLNDFIEKHVELLSAGGYRVMLDQSNGATTASVVRMFNNKELAEATEFGGHVNADRFWNVGDNFSETTRVLDEELDSNVPDADIDGQVVDADDLETMLDNPNHPLSRRALAAIGKRRQIGAGEVRWKSADGETIVGENMFGERVGDPNIYMPLTSAAPTMAKLSDRYTVALNNHRKRAAGYKVLNKPDLSPETLQTRAGKEAALDYFNSWADVINRHIRNDPIWKKMLNGESDEQILGWLKKTHEGAKHRNAVKWRGHDPEKWVTEHRQRLDWYVPDEGMKLRLKDNPVTPKELHKLDVEDMPDVYAPDVEMVGGMVGAGLRMGKMVDTIYNALGTVPTDVLVRQPYAAAMYNLKMKNLIGATEGKTLTRADLEAFEATSRNFAVKQVQKTLYELTDESNFTQGVRFLAPFWGAQEEAVRKWMNIAVEKPETVARFYVGINEAYDRATIIDEDGNPTKSPGNVFNWNPNDRMIFQIPKSLKHLPFLKEALANHDSVGYAFGTMNTALQGDMPFMPSMGPLVAIPADGLARAVWDDKGTEFDDNFIYRWLFPVGRGLDKSFASASLSSLLPGWGRRAVDSAQEDSRSYFNTMVAIQREMELDAKRRGLPEPSAKEVREATKWHFALRTVASFATPFAAEFRVKHQFWLDEYHKMQKLYGPDAFDRFVAKYGADAARFSSSSSEGIGVPPTSRGSAEWKRNEDLIASKYGKDWVSAIMSPDAWADDFSSDAYGAQFSIKRGPTDNETLRRFVGPEERKDDVDVRLGWLEHRQFTAAINAELYARGLTSTEQSGAEDLAQVKRDFIEDLASKNEAWGMDYSPGSMYEIYYKVNDLKKWAFMPRFNNRPDIQGARQYLMIRDATAESLDAHYLQGGSRNLQTQENTELRNWFYDQIGQLTQANPAFGEFYGRYLESDKLELGSGPNG